MKTTVPLTALSVNTMKLTYKTNKGESDYNDFSF